jgi:hypothetical protein
MYVLHEHKYIIAGLWREPGRCRSVVGKVLCKRTCVIIASRCGTHSCQIRIPIQNLLKTAFDHDNAASSWCQIKKNVLREIIKQWIWGEMKKIPNLIFFNNTRFSRSVPDEHSDNCKCNKSDEGSERDRENPRNRNRSCNPPFYRTRTHG